jgi:hypothetical protein
MSYMITKELTPTLATLLLSRGGEGMLEHK